MNKDPADAYYARQEAAQQLAEILRAGKPKLPWHTSPTPYYPDRPIESPGDPCDARDYH